MKKNETENLSTALLYGIRKRSLNWKKQTPVGPYKTSDRKKTAHKQKKNKSDFSQAKYYKRFSY